MFLSLIPIMLTPLFLCKSQPDSPDTQEYIDYYFVSEQLNWDDAQIYCEDSCDSNLASIQDPEQYKFAMFAIPNSTTDNVWIGLRYLEDKDKLDNEWLYLWVDRTGHNKYTPNGSNQSSWAQQQCIGMSPTNNYQWQDQICSVAQPFLCNNCMHEGDHEEMATTTVLLIVFGSFVCCCLCCWVIVYCKKDKIRMQLIKGNDKIHSKIHSKLNDGNIQPPGRCDTPKDLKKVASDSSKDVRSDEGDMDHEMEEGAQAEGHIEITKIESAVHLEVNAVGDDNKNDEKKEAVHAILDCMLSDVMKMPSLDPNKINAVYANDAESKEEQGNEQNENIAHSGGDGAISEKEEDKPKEGNLRQTKVASAVYLDIKAGDNENNNKSIANTNVKKMESLDPNQMEDVFDDIFNDENNETESEDSDQMYDTD